MSVMWLAVFVSFVLVLSMFVLSRRWSRALTGPRLSSTPARVRKWGRRLANRYKTTHVRPLVACTQRPERDGKPHGAILSPVARLGCYAPFPNFIVDVNDIWEGALQGKINK